MLRPKPSTQLHKALQLQEAFAHQSCLPPARSGAHTPRLSLLRQHPDNGHHPSILVIEDVAMIDEIAHDLAAEIHAYFHAGKFATPGPVRNLNRVVELPVLRRNGPAVSLQQQEMDLVDVEFVQ